ncbi:unnamed protein product [Sphagnum balticum]
MASTVAAPDRQAFDTWCNRSPISGEFTSGLPSVSVVTEPKVLSRRVRRWPDALTLSLALGFVTGNMFGDYGTFMGFSKMRNTVQYPEHIFDFPVSDPVLGFVISKHVRTGADVDGDEPDASAFDVNFCILSRQPE